MLKRINGLAQVLMVILIKAIFCLVYLLNKKLYNKLIYFTVSLFDDEALKIRENFDMLANKKAKKYILGLPNYGCEHYLKTGGCFMCGFNQELEKYKFKNYHPRVIAFSVFIFLEYLRMKSKVDNGVKHLYIYMAGSFLNPNELPYEAQKLVFDFFRDSDFERLVIESRPEYVLKNIERWRLYSELNGKEIKINIGLESSDDKIRNEIIGKNLSKKLFIKAVEKAKKSGFLVGTYLLLTTREMSRVNEVEDLITSANFATKAGSDLANIEVISIHENTNCAKMFANGKISLPSLWRVVEAVKKIDALGINWYLGEFSDWPEPIARPKSCEKCNNELEAAINEARLNSSVASLNALTACECSTLV